MSPADTPPLCVTIPEFGLLTFGLGTNPSYEAARRGLFPVIQYGGGPKVQRFRVAVRPALRHIAGNDPATFEAMTADFFAKWRALVESRKEKRRHGRSGAP
jgi:hypothetical protein